MESEIVVERDGEHLHRQKRILRARFDPTQVDRFVDTAHAANADHFFQLEAANQHAADRRKASGGGGCASVTKHSSCFVVLGRERVAKRQREFPGSSAERLRLFA